jgi:transcriptional repressor NrdR
MNCPRCSSIKTKVIDSREGIEGRSVRRRRECESCEMRFTTFERIEESFPLVIKKGGQRESFDRFKILNGLKKACEKRPVTLEQMENVVKDIEATILESNQKEINSGDIGELVIKALHNLDQVAYVRFASVYREFSDVSEFMDTLRSLAESSAKAVKGAKKVFSAPPKLSKTGKHAREEIGGIKKTTTNPKSKTVKDLISNPGEPPDPDKLQ